MIHPSRRFLHPHPPAWATALFLLALACGTQEGPADTSARLCGGAADVALRVEGDGAPRELCAEADSVSARLTAGGRYEVRAEFDDGQRHYRLEMVMQRRDDAPVKLTVTDSLAEVSSNPDAVWIQYRELPRAGPELESYAVAGGTFTLSFSDASVAAGTMSGISLQLREAAGSADAGQRLIGEGFFTFLTGAPAPAPPTGD